MASIFVRFMNSLKEGARITHPSSHWERLMAKVQDEEADFVGVELRRKDRDIMVLLRMVDKKSYWNAPVLVNEYVKWREAASGAVLVTGDSDGGAIGKFESKLDYLRILANEAAVEGLERGQIAIAGILTVLREFGI